MKILNLYFKNINSLQGESRIDFDQSPLADAGIFAITGPNGSGKSSILDAIMLALYGETYRFNKPAEHVMSKQSSDCFARIEFKLGDKVFRSQWQVAREAASAQGELQAPRMQLTQLGEPESILAETPAEVRTHIAELTGMDFHNFCQSMVLSQGQFSAFLNALDNERMSVLEKITGEKIYHHYRQQTQQTYEQLNTDIEAIKKDLETIPVIDQAALEAKQQDLQDFKQQASEFTQQKTELEQQLNWTTQLAESSQSIDALNKRHHSLQAQHDKNQQTLQDIEQAQPALLLKDDITDLDRHRNEIEEGTRTLNTLRAEVEQLQKQVQALPVDENTSPRDVSEQRQIIMQLQQRIANYQAELPAENALLQSTQQQLAEKKSSLEYTNNWLQEHEHDTALLTGFPDIEKLKRLRKSIADLSSKQKQHGQWSKTTTQSLNKNKSALKSTAKNIKERHAQQAKDEQAIIDWTQGKSFEELQDVHKEQQERVFHFQELYELAVVNSKVGKKSFLSRFRRSKFDMEKEEHELVAEQNTLQLEIGKEENIRKALEQAVSLEALMRKLVKDREKLVEGEPCPLCGATKHPYSHTPPSGVDSRKALADQRGKMQALRSHSDSLSIQIKEVKQQEQEETDKENKLKHIRSQWVVLSNRLNVADDRLDMDNLPLMKKMLATEKKQLTEINALLKKCTGLHNKIGKSKADIEKQEALLQRLQNENEKLNQEWDNRPRELVELEKNLEQYKADEKKLSSQVAEQLGRFAEKMPAAGQEDEVFERLNHRRREYQTYQTRQKLLGEEITSLEDKVSLCQDDVDDINQKMHQDTLELQQEEQAGLHLALVEKQQLVSQKEQQQQQEQTQLQHAKQALEEKLKHTPLTSVEDVKQKLSLIAQEQSLQQEQQALTEQLGMTATEKAKAEEHLISLQNQQPGPQQPDQLQAQLDSVKEKLSIASMEVSTLESKLTVQTNHQEKAETLQQQFTHKQTLLAQCEQDLKLINDENASAFRRKVQRDMIEQLLSQTNSILEKISGRFYVRHEDNQQGFSLRIEDSLQNNQRRLPKTLSGGESFVVSLALALALSETTSNGHAVDSLFIDEGFGNLDAESLYLVMNTLEGLKTQGKTVGIISHIDAVQKRIKTQIEMIKKPDGYSALKLAVS